MVSHSNQGGNGADAQERRTWVSRIGAGLQGAELASVEQAAALVEQAHAGQRLPSGEPYVCHVFAVAEILAGLRLDHATIVAALLHDVVEDTDVSMAQVEQLFGPEISALVDGVTKMGRVGARSGEIAAVAPAGEKDPNDSERLRKLLLTMVEDVRVVLIKLADRLHNMRVLKFLPEAEQRRIARETLDIYAPLANRLGIWQIKWELEDLAFRYLEPAVYKQVAQLLDQRRVDREQYIDNVVRVLRKELEKAGVQAEVSGRPKHIYSIWRKMQRKGVGFHEIFDVRAVRMIVNSLADCYAALGIVHTLWRHIPREFDDYIANPKGNHYRSLHTAVIGPGGQTLEVQIRTQEMHDHAELGVAAHWRYKEGGRFDPGIERKVSWLRHLLEWRDEEDNASDFVDRFKAEAEDDRVYVLTPKGSVIDLPKGATPLDFAYYIHTDVGHRCRGAKVNGSIVPLTHELQSGEQVEVLTTRSGAPSRDWLNQHLGYLKTSRARAKVRTWFKQQDQNLNITAGRQTLERELGRLGLNAVNRERLAQSLRYGQVDELLAAIGRGEVTTVQLAQAAQQQIPPVADEDVLSRAVRPRAPRKASDDVVIQGVGNLLTRIAGCCKPAPNDPIVGFITRGKGVTIHRYDCPNMLRIRDKQQERLIEVSWTQDTNSTYPLDIYVLAYDRQGLLRDITGILSNEKVNVVGVNTRTDPRDHLARMTLSVEVVDIEQLSRVLTKMAQLPNVVEARRAST